MEPFNFFQRLNHKVREQYARGQLHFLHEPWHESWRNIACRTLFFVILLIILLGIMEHHRLRNSCEGGRWRVVDGEVVCVHSPDIPVAGQ